MTMTRSQHAIVIALAVMFGIVCILPNIWLRRDAGAAYQGVEFQAADAESHYTARVREVMDGQWAAANVYYDGPKQQPYLFAPLPEIVIAGIGTLLHMDAPSAMVLTRALWGGVLLFILVGFLTALTGRWAASTLAVTVLMLAGPLVPWPSMLFRLIGGTAGALDFLPYTRPIHPQWSSILLFGALWAFLMWTRTKSVRPLLIAAACTIASFYTYIFVWTFLGVVYAAYTIRALIRREWHDVRQIMVFGVVILLGAAPYLWNVMQAAQHPFYAETAQRHGMVASHAPVMSITLLLLVALIAYGWKRKRFGLDGFFVVSLGIAAVAVLNQQVLTGQSLAAPHYHWYTIRPLFILILVMLITGWVERSWVGTNEKRRRLFLFLCAALVVGSFAFGVAFQRQSYLTHRRQAMQWQPMAPALWTLREQTRPGDVVYAPDFFRSLVAMVTSADVYWANDAYLYLSPDTRSRDAYFFDLWVLGVSADDAATSFYTDRREELSSRLHAIYWREHTGAFRNIPDADVAEAVSAYRAFLAQTDDERIRAYPMDIAVIPRALPDSDGIRALRQAGTRFFEDRSYEMYRLPRNR